MCLIIGNVFFWVGYFGGVLELYLCGLNVIVNLVEDEVLDVFDVFEFIFATNRVFC